MPITMASSSSIHLLLFLFFSSSSIAAEESTLESACKSTMCGTVNISSPFWTRGGGSTSARTYDCGYPGFGIDCFNNTPIFNLSNVNYSVKSISYPDYTFTLVDTSANETCPRARHNVSIDPNLPLNFSSRADLIDLNFYFNCTSDLARHDANISCLKSGENMSFVFVKGTEPGGIRWGCDEVVEVKVMDGEIDEDRNLIGGYGDAMRKGFELNWGELDDCGECWETGGRCGVSRLSDGNETFVCLCPGHDNFGTSTNQCRRGGRSRLLRLLLPVGLVVSVLLLLGCYYWRKLSTWFKKTNLCNEFKEDEDENLESFIRNHQTMASMRYTYNDIKRITNSFKERLGEGGYGTVYKGKLLDKDKNKENETHVAVKILNKLKGNGEDFVNEVSSISRTSHVNVVNLMGFCLDNGKRALVYEFMPNGSLDKFIHKDFVRLGKWGKLRQIAIGIARGLEYLHLGCNTRILHFDIKPQNILLDENDIPKISDFGLAKMCAKNESIVSMVGARGTIGYIAPEIVSRILGKVSYKSDVYSYGMLVLEMIGVVKGMHSRNENIMEESSDVYFPHYVYKHLQRDNIEMLLHGDMKNEEIDFARKMILVGLWCIQMDPSRRPHMSKVVEMLEGSLDAMQNPPNPSDHCSDFMGNSSFNSMVDDSLCSFK